MKRIEKPFLVVVIAIFIAISIFHFIRLSLGWEVLVDEWSVPTLISGFIIIISAFISYWAWIILNYEEEEQGDKKEGEGESESGGKIDNREF